MFRRGRLAVVYVLGAVCGLLLIIGGIRRGTWSDVVVGLVILLVVFAASPIGLQLILRLFPKPVDPERIESAPVVVYWRPLDQGTADLRMWLGKLSKQVLWVNIWRDPAAAERLRGLIDGAETVPTAVIGDRVVTTPDAAVIRSALEAGGPAQP